MAQPEVTAGVRRSAASPSAARRPTTAQIFVPLKPWDERQGKEHSVRGDGGAAARAAGADRRRAWSCRSSRRPSAAWAAFGRLPVHLSRRPAGRSLDELATVHSSWWREANGSRLRGAFTSFTANDPLLDVEVDRAEGQGARRAAGAGLRHAADLLGQPVRQRLQLREPHLPRVRAGRAAVPRPARRTSAPSTCAATTGRDDSARVAGDGDADVIARRSSATTTCSARRRSTARPRPGVSSGQALRGDGGARPRDSCPPGMSYEWTGIASSRRRAAGRRRSSSRSACSFVFLVLAAQYESFILPFDHPLGAAGHPGRARACSSRAARQRRVLPGRPGHAGRPGQQERDPDRRVRRAAARAGQERRGGGDRGGARSGCGRS